MTTTTSAQSVPVESHQTFWDVTKTELLKLRSGRGKVAYVMAIIVIPVLLALFESFSAQSQWRLLTPAQRHTFNTDPLQAALTGVLLAQVIIAIWAATSITGEYSTHFVRTMLQVTPKRLRYLAAKMFVISIVMFVLMEIAVVLSFLVSQAMLSAQGPPAAVSWTSPVIVHALIGTGLYAVLLSLMAISIGVLIRYTTGATLVLFTICLVIFVFGTFSKLLGDLVKFFPVDAIFAQIAKEPPSPTFSPWVSLLIMAIETLVLVVVAARVFRRRDA